MPQSLVTSYACLDRSTPREGVQVERYHVRLQRSSEPVVVALVRLTLRPLTPLTLVLSKVSEAVAPKDPANVVGPGAPLAHIAAHHPAACAMMNGAFNHYAQERYPWSPATYAVGEPAAVANIRHHRFRNAWPHRAGTGAVGQRLAGAPWEFFAQLPDEGVVETAKYFLSSRPVLVSAGAPVQLPDDAWQAAPAGVVTPPGALWHGTESHPRSGIGFDRQGHMIWAVAQRRHHPALGLTLLEWQAVAVALEIVDFLNLDGGGSAQLHVKASPTPLDTTASWTALIAPEDPSRAIGHAFVVFDDREQNVHGTTPSSERPGFSRD